MSAVPVVVASCLLMHARLPQDIFPTAGGEQVVFVSGAAGGSVELPCCLEPRATGDKPKLILWYKAGTRTPLFSHDGRSDQKHHQQQQSQNARYDMGANMSVHVTESSATLTKRRLGANDEGLYECRVDFFRSPTLTAMYNLTIILPAEELEVEGWGGQALAGGSDHSVTGVVAGPYKEGQKLHLSCTARGGSPRPNVTWWRGDTLVDRGWEVKGPGMVCNDLVVPHLNRQWFRTRLKCKASTTPELPELSVTLTIDMLLLPSAVVVADPGVVQAGDTVRVRCTATGARPAAEIVWIREGQILDLQTETESWPSSQEGPLPTSTTVSELIINVTHEDDGREVTCSASSLSLPTSEPIMNSTHLKVLYPPIVTASLGRSLDPNQLTAGGDVYFTCHVKANPPPGSVVWYREGEVQQPGDGVVLSGSDLVLQKVSRRKAGRYWCSSSNSIKTTTSEPVHLKLNYVPECRSSPATFFVYDQPINVTCQVTSSPPVQSFHWRWNFTSEGFSFRLLTEATSVSASSGSGSYQWSVVQITARPDGETGVKELFCYGINEVGTQEKPCKFLVKVASAPPPLSSCRLLNITSSSLSVTCDKPTTPSNGTSIYRAEVYLASGELLANVTSSWPSFRVNKLDPATTYSIKVYVSRGPSTSPPILVSALTSSTANMYSVEETGPEPPAPPNASSVSIATSTSLHLLGWSIGGVLVTALALQLYCRGRRRNWWRRTAGEPPDSGSGGELLPPMMGRTGSGEGSTSPQDRPRDEGSTTERDEDETKTKWKCGDTLVSLTSSFETSDDLNFTEQKSVDLTKHGTSTAGEISIKLNCKRGLTELSPESFEGRSAVVKSVSPSGGRVNDKTAVQGRDHTSRADCKQNNEVTGLDLEKYRNHGKEVPRSSCDEVMRMKMPLLKKNNDGKAQKLSSCSGFYSHANDKKGEENVVLVNAMSLMTAEESTL